jgi:superfamily I DNA/RNA helicase
MKQIVQDRKTFAACRYVCDEHKSLSAKLNEYDVIIVDEMQDLISAQEQRLLFQTCKPVVLVGDPMQAINTYRDDPPCKECYLEQEEAPPLPCKIEWYGTWRLDGFTARFIEERFGRRMYSYRACDETAEIYWKDELVYKDNTLIMCRHNKNVVETAVRYPHMKVVNGDSLAGRLITASKDTSMVTPMAKYAQDLRERRELDSVCTLLRDRTISLSNVKDVAAVTTVHQAKGFEYDHCAVHSDLLFPEDEDEGEKNISFVAFTRHKKSLVVMRKRNAC